MLEEYFTRISPVALIGWRSDVTRAGHRVLTEIRIKDREVVQEGDFGEKSVDVVRVYRVPIEGPGRFVIYKRPSGQGKYTEDETGPYTLRGPQGGVPLFTVYTGWERFGAMEFLETVAADIFANIGRGIVEVEDLRRAAKSGDELRMLHLAVSPLDNDPPYDEILVGVERFFHADRTGRAPATIYTTP